MYENKHFVPHFPPNFPDIACQAAELSATRYVLSPERLNVSKSILRVGIESTTDAFIVRKFNLLVLITLYSKYQHKFPFIIIGVHFALNFIEHLFVFSGLSQDN